MILTLPWPPSTNRLWRAIQPKSGPPRNILSSEAREYHKRAADAIFMQSGGRPPSFGDRRISLVLQLHAPTTRRHDISNRIKVVEDCLVESRIFDDDSQVDDLRIQRMHVDTSNPRIRVIVEAISA